LQCENNTIVKNTDNEVEIDFESLSE
jgi:hypothetical protein